MSQEVDVLYMIVRLILTFHLLLGLSGMYTFQNAESPALHVRTQ